MAPRFTISRITGEVTCHKPIEGRDLFRIQECILKKQTELHPEIFTEEGLCVKNTEITSATLTY